MGREDGFASVLDGIGAGGWDGEAQWFGGRGVESPKDCVG